MKFITTVVFYFYLLSLFGQQAYTDKEGRQHLWGTIEIDQLHEEPFQEWYLQNFKDQTTELNFSEVAQLKNVTVKIFIGTWCGDTKYLLPRFIKTWTDVGLSTDQLELIALHHEGDLYKQAPSDIAKQYSIHRVPTFVFEENGKEINRIIERTVFDLDTDLKAIANNFPYQPRYKAVQEIQTFLNETTKDSLLTKTSLDEGINLIRREVLSSSELNTYGYVLKASGEMQKAEFIFKLNRYLFPYNPNIRDSYGEILLENNKLEHAQTEYYEALRIKQTDQHIIRQLAQIDERIQKK